MLNEPLDSFTRALGKDPDKMRRQARKKIYDWLERKELEDDDLEDSIIPQSTTFIIRVPRISRKAARDPDKRKAILPEAKKAVRFLEKMLKLAERTEYLATEPDAPIDILENGAEDEVVDLSGTEPVRRVI